MIRFNTLYDSAFSAEENMEKDRALYELCEHSPSAVTLRFYSWNKPSVTYGYNQSKKILSEYSLTDRRVSVGEYVKRPTGGGIVFHDTQCITFSLIFPFNYLGTNALLSTYHLISDEICSVLNDIGIMSEVSSSSKRNYHSRRIDPVCHTFPAKYEILSRGKKIVGSAQKKGKVAMLQQTQFFISISDSDRTMRLLSQGLQKLFKK